MRYIINIPDRQKRILMTAGLLFLFLLYVGDFSIRQSIVLALIFALLALYVEKRSQGPALRFCPYYLSVKPNWFQILTDFKLLAKPEHWQTVQELISDVPPTEYTLLRDNIIFTVIQPKTFLTRQVIYWSTIPYHGYFVSQIDFSEDINPLSFERRKDFEAILGKDVPRFFMRSGPDGYNLGLNVPNTYWEKMKVSCPEPVHERHEHAIGRVELTLAIIPHCEFDLYWEPLEWSDTFNNKTLPRMRQRIDEYRKKFNWKTKGHADLPELAINWPDVIEHRYFTVKHREI